VLPVLLLMVLLVQPLQAGAQQSWQDNKKPGKRPPLRVRVVTDARMGVPIVVAGGEQADGSTGEVAPANGIAVRLPGREIENWLTGGPPRQESWLNGTRAEPAQAPAEQPLAAPAATGSTQLLGVQHYMESMQARPETQSPTADTLAVTFAVPPREKGAIPAPVAAPAVAQSASVVGTYLLGPGDEIDVHVWRNADLSRRVPVRPDGLISLPLAGELMASGKTVAQLSEDITTVLADFVQYPTVTVTVTQVRSMVVYVTGRVARAGTLTLERPINVVQAITMAGGMQEFADRNGVVVIRTVNGRQVRIPYRYGDAVKGKGNIGELMLQSGDVVYVP